MFRLMSFLLLLVLSTSTSLARPSTPEWVEQLQSLPIQDGGRVMPLGTYANRLASQLTGRRKWSAGKGPEAFSAREPMQLLCDLLYSPAEMLHKPLVAVENIPFKKRVGLDEKRRFFNAVEIAGCKGINDLLNEFAAAQATNQNLQPDKFQRMALDLQAAVERIASFASGTKLAVVPPKEGRIYLGASPTIADPGAEGVRDALAAFGLAYKSGAPLEGPAAAIVTAIKAAGTPSAEDMRAVRLETFYNSHRPWIMTAVAYGLSLVFFGLSRVALRRVLCALAIAAAIWGMGEHILGMVLRVGILGRAPVSNTYESLLWLGLVAVATGAVAQLINRRAWYLVGGLIVGFLSVLFSNLVPLESRTGAIPAVLRSNYWLIVHVLTIVASYGVLALASLLGHVYLVKEVILRKRATPQPETRLAHPLIAQTYRAIQLGLLLLTAGTILGGVWAADSWGRFWGWDPKETWALISIVIYFAVLHARYVRWLRDFGLAASAVLGFAAIVWTFYGVNYVMATGLHSYGSGAGGAMWVGVWMLAEIAFVVVCWMRHKRLERAAGGPSAPARTNGTTTSGSTSPATA
jgi:cytochrome c-type biogenesis protein CcsB